MPGQIAPDTKIGVGYAPSCEITLAGEENLSKTSDRLPQAGIDTTLVGTRVKGLWNLIAESDRAGIVCL